MGELVWWKGVKMGETCACVGETRACVGEIDRGSRARGSRPLVRVPPAPPTPAGCLIRARSACIKHLGVPCDESVPIPLELTVESVAICRGLPG
jgi:hypothetical protein